MGKYRTIKPLPPLIFGFMAMFFLQCSMDLVGGFGSETTNGVTVSGVVISQDGTPAAGVDIFIRSESFLKDTSDTQAVSVPDAVTTSTGAFAVDSVDTGTYFIEVNDGSRNAVLVKCNVNTFIPGTMNLDTIQLQPSAGFYGIVDRENIPISENIFVQIFGLDRMEKAATSGEFAFGGLPAGVYILRIASNDTALGVLEYDTIEIEPAENYDAGTFILPFEFWRDTVVVRTILDTNGLTYIPVSHVVRFGKEGRVVECNLTHQNVSILPGIVGKLRLRALRLNENFLDSLPDEIGRMQSLVHLILQKNQLIKLPETIGDLTHLEHLDLSGNRLPELPLSITNLKKLEFLTVIHNRLHAVPPPVKIWLDTYSFEKNWQELQDPFE